MITFVFFLFSLGDLISKFSQERINLKELTSDGKSILNNTNNISWVVIESITDQYLDVNDVSSPQAWDIF